MSPRLYEPLRRDPQIAATWIVPCVAMAVVACASKSAENFKVEQPLDSRIKERGGSRIRVNLDSCWSYSTHRIFSIRRLNCLSKGPLTVSKQNENECSRVSRLIEDVRSKFFSAISPGFIIDDANLCNGV